MESVCWGNSTVGSNPTLSANLSLPRIPSANGRQLKSSAKVRFRSNVCGSLSGTGRNRMNRADELRLQDLCAEKVMLDWSGGDSFVSMMQPANLRDFHDSA